MADHIEDDPLPFKVEGVDDEDGSRTELGSYASSAVAREFMFRYVRTGNAGGWYLIEVYDCRGEPPERLHYWMRPDKEDDDDGSW